MIISRLEKADLGEQPVPLGAPPQRVCLPDGLEMEFFGRPANWETGTNLVHFLRTGAAHPLRYIATDISLCSHFKSLSALPSNKLSN